MTVGAQQWDAFKEGASSRHRYPMYGLGWFGDGVQETLDPSLQMRFWLLSKR